MQVLVISRDCSTAYKCESQIEGVEHRLNLTVFCWSGLGNAQPVGSRGRKSLAKAAGQPELPVTFGPRQPRQPGPSSETG